MSRLTRRHLPAFALLVGVFAIGACGSKTPAVTPVGSLAPVSSTSTLAPPSSPSSAASTTTLPLPPATLAAAITTLTAQSTSFSQTLTTAQAAGQVKTAIATATGDYVQADHIGLAAVSGLNAVNLQLQAYVQGLQASGDAPIALVADIASLKETAASMTSTLAPVPAQLLTTARATAITSLVGLKKNFTSALDVLTAFKNAA